MLTIKVLGPGCQNCQNVEKAARTPGLVINEKVVSAGRIPSVAEVMTWLADALQAN